MDKAHEGQYGPKAKEPLDTASIVQVIRRAHVLPGHPCGRWICWTIHGIAQREFSDDTMSGNKGNTSVSPEFLQLLMAQFPGRLALNRTETARALGFKNAITVDRLRQRGLLRASVATRRPTYPLTEIARFLTETSEGV